MPDYHNPYIPQLLAIRDKEALETSDICLRIMSTLIVAAGAILTLSIELAVGERCNPHSWVLQMSILLLTGSSLAALIAIGILLIRRIRRTDIIGAKAGEALDNKIRDGLIDIEQSRALFFVLLACVGVSFVLFAIATITLGLYAWLS